MNDDDVRAALAELGPFFAVEAIKAVEPVQAAGRAEAAGEGPGPWRSMAELADPADPADGSGALAARVAAVRGVLAAGGGQPAEAVEERVAASVVHLGLVARLLSPYLALAVLYGRAPGRVRLADLRWRPALGGPYPLALPLPLPPGTDHMPGTAADRTGVAALGTGADLGTVPDVGTGADLAALADRFSAAVCEGAVREVESACAGFRVSPHVLRGNTASAVNGAARMIAAARPDAAARAEALTGLLLERGRLRGSGRRTPGGGFRRNSCCLIYRAAPGHAGALCGDCALSRVPVRPG
ncbi:(2Fe-2S)-binding protein [Streptomyces sp. NPDC087270]|uniref:(2Fe-2S)-binding protein n=1 Tax=Streptomyces sp. NPDC087270 TaxID=3365774 RepID=UPI00382FF7F9